MGQVEVRETLNEFYGMGRLLAAVVTCGGQSDMVDSAKEKEKFKKKMYEKLKEAALKKKADGVYKVEYEFQHAPAVPFPGRRGYAKARGVMFKFK